MSHVPPQPVQPDLAAPQPPKSNGLATAGLVLGILAIVVSFIPIVNVIVWPLAILGLIFGGIGLAKSGKVGKGKGPSITALVTSILAIVMFFVMNAVFFKAVDEAVKETQKELDKSFDSAKVEDGSKGSDANPVLKDFRVSKCAVVTGELGKELTLHIDYTNNGDRRYNYFLEGEVLADGKKVSDFMSTADNLAPKQTFTDKDAGILVSGEKLEGAKKVECKVVTANRNDF
ncbi:DUF4190 domain-containing protein [Streptomyces sp. TRM64462]|uniref:DUF4190 domain-containing protein n=1 Tax=Streptomyces sp. TRM64462 TaxID=2741726 RepID=UPI001586789B|nr:DUF4190 domain-containing protein [Streptomyces sp. TRM64462]